MARGTLLQEVLRSLQSVTAPQTLGTVQLGRPALLLVALTLLEVFLAVVLSSVIVDLSQLALVAAPAVLQL